MTSVRCKPKGKAPLCACGCGQATHWNGSKNRWALYLQGHQNTGRRSPLRKEKPPPPLCACGCGQPVRTYRYRRGWAKYLNNHAPRKPHTPEAIEKMRQAALNRSSSISEANRRRLWTDESRARARQAKLEAHPEWSGNSRQRYWRSAVVSRYAMDKIKARIRIRDGHRCVVCHKPQGERVHHVHHVDGDLNNNAEANLVTLCVSCHNLVDLVRSPMSLARLNEYVETLNCNT